MQIQIEDKDLSENLKSIAKHLKVGVDNLCTTLLYAGLQDMLRKSEKENNHEIH